ncbi:equilibrative nucleoside transporter 1-like [Hippoglossus hippoglossus]|uniref:equilibrative nucleoside transporter 1-like n=1 Tax=Hippoglossus hippoglossus TaxID=8267 RepID=UPI00148DC648|nr:equilibrative nucleoside transporter 1-like [Hippoglossus hippoglossus]XP_034464754.1 equilibrative nucleoside transporter 1-like [Hippoglossus hippoglossus]XP_034464755.1 equilibrative nucleoside transporter 1-like [Hippoglossus hippoglossus]XP_034464756.1 equilibrative nucleoside transporter 1-like [Hippoglossus hippoglossus]
MTAINAPQDKYNAVWIIFFILGLGTLLPWNFFMTATMYFTSRLKDPPTPLFTNVTANSSMEGVDTRNVLESKFNNVMTLCAMVPLLIFTCLNSFIHQRIPQKLRISGSLTVILVVFLLTAVFVKVDMAPMTFFTVTMIKIICINSFGAILQGSLFGLAGMLPASYTTPIMSGQGLAGAFAAFSMICALASGSALQDSAFGYFITACVVIFLAIMSYLALPRMEFFQYYTESNRSRPSDDDEENKMDFLKNESPAEKRPVVSLMEDEAKPSVSVVNIFKQIWVMALSVCFIFTVTIGTFPAVTVEVMSTVANGGGWDKYFIPVSCFLLFNVMDWAGRSLTAVCMWPGKDSLWLPVLVALRVVFIPLFMLCNVQPRNYLPVLFSHDAWYIIFMIFFSFSNGYLASLCMCFGPKKVPPHEAETAGAIMAFFLSLGLALGAAISFAFRAMI